MMEGDDYKIERYKIIKDLKNCYLHECVRTSICFTLIVQLIIKDMKPVWRQIGKFIFYFV